jgi:nicotinate-nucleotide adenylyltransferase
LTLLPPHPPGLRIGLYGGSFNPPHRGHLHVSLMLAGLPSLAERMAAARALARHPRIAVTGFEAAIGARYTLDTLEYLGRHAPGARFVWLMGADNLAQFHRWRGWRRIAALMPFAVVDRPGWTLKATHAKAALALQEYRIDETDAAVLADLRPPAWVFLLHGPRSTLSSTVLRQQRSRTF